MTEYSLIFVSVCVLVAARVSIVDENWTDAIELDGRNCLANYRRL